MFQICLVTDEAMGDNPSSLQAYLDFIERAVKAGIDVVEWRVKHQPIEKIYQARAIKELLQTYRVPLLINDYPMIAKEILADGVHLGNKDMAVAEARNIIGAGKIIGVSIESHDDLHRANQNSDIDYVTASAIFASHNKNDLATIWGISGLKKLLPLSQKPMTAIGGIDMSNLVDVMATGVRGVAMIGCLHQEWYGGERVEKVVTAIKKIITT